MHKKYWAKKFLKLELDQNITKYIFTMHFFFVFQIMVIYEHSAKGFLYKVPLVLHVLQGNGISASRQWLKA